MDIKSKQNLDKDISEIYERQENELNSYKRELDKQLLLRIKEDRKIRNQKLEQLAKALELCKKRLDEYELRGNFN